MDDYKDRFLTRAGLSGDASLWELVEGVRAIPYGRPSVRTPSGVVDEWTGTCSTKHALLASLLESRPAFELQLVHRVYRVTPSLARERFGASGAATVPDEGLVDVHTYATVLIEGRRVAIDVTFPSPVVWDGRSDMELACGPGTDVPASDDPWEQKAALIAEHCDPSVREPFIAALTSSERPA
jgi:hypothetical protein